MHALPIGRPGVSSDAWAVLSRIYDVRGPHRAKSGLRLAVAASIGVHLAVLAWPMLERTRVVAPAPLQARLMPTRPEPSSPTPLAMPASRSAATPRTDRLAQPEPGAAVPAPETAAAPVAPAVMESTPVAVERVEEAPPRFDAEYLANPAPEYPRFARQRGIEGRVLLRVLVCADGTAKQIELAHGSGNELLDQSALRTVRQWRFVPARRGQSAIEAWVQVPVAFRLKVE